MRLTAWGRVLALTICCALIPPGALSARAQSNRALDSGTHTANSGGTDSLQKETRTPGMANTIAKSADASLSYVIGPGDVLAVNVWKDAELSRTMPVRPDGRISLPVLGEVQAAGLTAEQLQVQIGEKLGDYMRDPQVNVIVEEIKSRSFNVVGKVAKAGSFALAKPTTVLDALAEAGGFQDFARQTKIYVLRHAPNGSARMIPFNYKQVIKGRRVDENIELQPEDTVVVP